MNIYSQIKQTLQNICQNPTESALILAQVKSVQEQTCTVIINNTLELTDVRLRAVQDNQETGILITPTVGSYVMITDLSNSNKTDFAVIMYSQIDKIEINKGARQMSKADSFALPCRSPKSVL